MSLTTDKQARKERPMARGVLDYFPDALAEVAHVSFVGNQQHNPGEPLHWAKEKSTDHADCIMRHLADRGTTDDDGMRHSAKAAWRALALLQIELDGEKVKPDPRNVTSVTYTAEQTQGIDIHTLTLGGEVVEFKHDETLEKHCRCEKCRPTRRKLRIAFDLDSVLNRLDDVWAEWVRDTFDPEFEVAKWTQWDLHKCVPRAGTRVYEFLHHEGVFRNLPVTPGAVECLKKLHDEGHELFIVTSTIPSTWEDKVEWLRTYFPFIPKENMIASSRKGLMRVDVLVDDGLHNFEEFQGVPIVFDRPWNREGLRRLDGYRCYDLVDLPRLIKEIE